MIIAFQIVLLIVILFSAFGIVGEKDNKQLQENMTLTFIMSALIFLVTVIWL